jgi:predicted outer membrane repeat protein
MPLLVVILLLATITPSLAAGNVTACATDVQQGAGVNFKTAVAGGGQVTFGCPPNTVIRLTQGYQLTNPTDIDGGNNVTLDAHDAIAFFHATASASRVVLRNLRLLDGPDAFPHPVAGVGFGGAFFGPVHLELRRVRVEKTRYPLVANRITVEDSQFIGNSGTVLRSPTIHVRRSFFFDNRGAPMTPLTGTPPTDGTAAGEIGAGSATVEDATFNTNLAITWNGSISVKRSNFTNNGNDEASGGALWIDGEGRVEASEFINNRAKDGGAIFLKRGSLEIRRTKFRGNRATHVGGAIFAGPQAIFAEGSSVKLSTSHFETNLARNGGAIGLVRGLFSPNSLQGKLVKFAGNSAGESGGAIYSNDATIELSRALFVQNEAGSTGGAISLQGLRADRTRLGNVLMVRNTAPLAGGYIGSRIEIANSTLADNTGGAIRMTLPTGLVSTHAGELRMRNTILLNNNGNCPPPEDQASVIDEGENIQFPGADCGPTVAETDPGLDSMYVPVPGSPARFAGDNKTCMGHDLVLSKDVLGDSRPQGRRCTIGAIERDLERHALKALRQEREKSPLSPLRRYLAILGLKRYSTP